MWTATEPSHRHAFKPGSPGAAKRGQGPGPGFVACAVAVSHNIGALIIRIGFWGPVYYSYNKEPPGPYSNYCGPYIMWGGGGGDVRVPIASRLSVLDFLIPWSGDVLDAAPHPNRPMLNAVANIMQEPYDQAAKSGGLHPNCLWCPRAQWPALGDALIHLTALNNSFWRTATPSSAR